MDLKQIKKSAFEYVRNQGGCNHYLCKNRLGRFSKKALCPRCRRMMDAKVRMMSGEFVVEMKKDDSEFINTLDFSSYDVSDESN